jgi:small subunit ribosomal protein S16
MAVKISLSRAGKKSVPFHTIVVADSRKKRDGAIIENIGTYDGLNTKIVLFKEDRYLDWVAKGALPTDSAKRIYKLYKKSTGASTGVQKSAPVVKKAAAKKGRSAAQTASTETAEVQE